MEIDNKESVLISIVIPNYNYGRYIGSAIESALSQTYQHIEVIVVDDGSTDESIALLSKYTEKVKIFQRQNQGVGAARNFGVSQSSGKYIAFLDADDIWEPEKLEKQLKLFMADSELGLVSCWMREFSYSNAEIRIYTCTKSDSVAESLLYNKGNYIPSGSAIMISREVFYKAGGFSEIRKLHPSEDWEFCYRVATISKVSFVDEILVKYRSHGMNGHLKLAKLRTSMRLFFRMHFKRTRATRAKRRMAYARLYFSLAGGYFQNKKYIDFLRCFLVNMFYSPKFLFKYLGKMGSSKIKSH